MTTRDPSTGQYAYDNDFDRLCRCGHTLGEHVDGGFDCIYTVAGPVVLRDAPPCPCRKFRPTGERATPSPAAQQDISGTDDQGGGRPR